VQWRLLLPRRARGGHCERQATSKQGADNDAGEIDRFENAVTRQKVDEVRGLDERGVGD
jgi:hypothetical protein